MEATPHTAAITDTVSTTLKTTAEETTLITSLTSTTESFKFATTHEPSTQALTTTAPAHGAPDLCSTAVPVQVVRDHRLVGHSMMSVSARSKLECLARCLQTNGCKSVNYKAVTNQCEVNSRDVTSQSQLSGGTGFCFMGNTRCHYVMP